MKIFQIISQLPSKLQKAWQDLIQALTTSFELQVWQTQKNGQVCWHAYDPKTGRSACFGCEDDMRVWIEQRYYAN